MDDLSISSGRPKNGFKRVVESLNFIKNIRDVTE